MQSVEMTKIWEHIKNFDLQQKEDMKQIDLSLLI